MPCVPMTADATNARNQSASFCTLPVHDFTAFEVALHVGAREPRCLQLLLREELELIARVRRSGLRRIAVGHQRPRAHGLTELDRGDIAVSAGGPPLSVLVLGEAHHAKDSELARSAIGGQVAATHA